MLWIYIFAALFFFLSYLIYKNREKLFPRLMSLKKMSAELYEAQETIGRLQHELQSLQQPQSLRDPVTHLLGWKLFEDRLGQCIKESARYHFSFSVLYVDIDNFKMINNTLGNDIGNQLLKNVAERLQSCIRQVDSASRYSKDTYVILLNQLAKPETTVFAAQRILQSIAEPFQIQDQELYITARIGIAVYPQDGEDTPTLLRNAESALFLSKNKNEVGYQFYQNSMHVASQRELLLCSHLNKENLYHELIFYFQPIVCVSDQSIFCMDTLLHWQHPDFGLISYQELSSYAARQRKLNHICEWVLRNALRQYLQWRSLGFSPAFLGIPLTIAQLENSHFICTLSQIIQEVGANPEWLLVQAKGNIQQASVGLLGKAFNMLTYMGVKLALDDFAAEFFSLTQIKTFPIHYLKLSSLMLKEVDVSAQAVELLKALIYLARTMNMQVIAQGVESERQMQVLQEAGCVLMQGQKLGAPMIEQEVTEKMMG